MPDRHPPRRRSTYAQPAAAPSRRAQRELERTTASHRSTLPRTRTRTRRRRTLRPLGQLARTLLVLAIVPAFALAVTVPANALRGPAGTPPAGTISADGQQIKVSDQVRPPEIATDSYSFAKVPTTGNYAQTASTFVNYLGDIQWPFRAGVPISTDFGPRIPPCFGCSSYHKGIDMNPGVGSPIQAIAAGVVREVSAIDNGGLGVYAVIDHRIDGRLVSSVYAHMKEGSLAVSVGETVTVTQLVGNVGNTGQSTGPHLHFEILLDGTTPTDPYTWLTERVTP